MHYERNTTAPPQPFDVDLRILAIGPERVPWLGALIETARTDLRPRDFAERHLVDEMAINKWRLLRIYGMEKSVYEHQLATFKPASTRQDDGERAEPNEDLYHLALTHSHEHDGIILAALSRLEARFHRQFYAALRMLIVLRRANPVNPNPTQLNPTQSSRDRKDPSTCELSNS
ncbi:MAG: hypothetical protein JWN34_1600, partial [Bryobacterales bacterium]|nr:hypothetical protein [Bryobacterales bacterium]